MNTDRVMGAAKEFGGKVQSAVGDAAGDAGTGIEGRFRQAEGVAQNLAGQAADAVNDVADQVGTYAQEAYTQGGKVMRRATHALEGQVHEAPATSLAVIAIMSFVLGYAVRAASAR